MRSPLLAGLIVAGLVASGCGESTNRWDGIAIDRFETDPIFELVPTGATQSHDAISIGSPESQDFGSDNARGVLWKNPDEPAEVIARRYADALIEQGWSEVAVECTMTSTLKAAYLVTAVRAVDDYVDTARVVSSNGGTEQTVGINVSTPFHASPQPDKPDPSVPPDTACLDALSI